MEAEKTMTDEGKGKLIVLKHDGLTVNEVRGKFIHDQSDKRYRVIKGVAYHCFRVETDAGILGTIFIPSDRESMPKRLVLEYAEKDS